MSEELYYIQAEGPGVARGKNRICLAFVTPRLPICKPLRSSRLAGQREHIYKCLVLFYRRSRCRFNYNMNKFKIEVSWTFCF